MVFEFLKKKKMAYEDELPPIPDEPEELPPLPPLPGEEEYGAPPEYEAPPAWPKAPRGLAAPEAPPLPEMPTQVAPQVRMGAECVFVRIDKYRDVMKKIDDMQDKLAELQSTLNRISAIKGKEAEIIDGWNAMLQEAKSKIDDVNSKLSKTEVC